MLRIDINLVFTIVNILVLFLCMKIFLFKPVNKVLEQRQAMVRKQFEDAEEAQKKAEELKAEYEASLANARQESECLLAEARKNADAEYERRMQAADEEAALKMQKAEENIREEKARSMRDMQGEIKNLVVNVASRVVGEQVSAENSGKLYDDFIAEMGERK